MLLERLFDACKSREIEELAFRRRKRQYAVNRLRRWIPSAGGNCSDTVYNGYKDNRAAMLLFDGLRRVVVDYGYGYTEEYDVEVYLSRQKRWAPVLSP
ncbi:MAG: hypothetical protein ACLU4N_24590 [Butyricimonas faecihominis]